MTRAARDRTTPKSQSQPEAPKLRSSRNSRRRLRARLKTLTISALTTTNTLSLARYHHQLSTTHHRPKCSIPSPEQRYVKGTLPAPFPIAPNPGLESAAEMLTEVFLRVQSARKAAVSAVARLARVNGIVQTRGFIAPTVSRRGASQRKGEHESMEEGW